MSYQAGIGNEIDVSAQISDDVVIGNYNYIGKNVVIGAFKGTQGGKIVIGDCNQIHEDTRIVMGAEGLSVGDWNVFHNNMLVMGGQRMEIGHNCWFGQNTILDSAGGLFIGNGVRVGMYSQIWTHVASGELIEGCTLYAQRSTSIEDDVWLVGSCIVGSGLNLGRRAVCMIGSLITKDLEPNKVYRGSPASEVEGLHFYRSVTDEEKMRMMIGWVDQFVEQSGTGVSSEYLPHLNTLRVKDVASDELLVIGFEDGKSDSGTLTTYFDLKGKTYSKRLTTLERQFYRFIFDHKARFLPIGKN